MASENMTCPDVVVLGTGHQVVQQPSGMTGKLHHTVCKGQPALKLVTCCLQGIQRMTGRT